ncbi:deaminase, partial [Cohnella faecalis]|uniref:deaminase n=1 Tax=Cohnella faecalis TaxID=2315694 RepID=UPI003989A3B0
MSITCVSPCSWRMGFRSNRRQTPSSGCVVVKDRPHSRHGGASKRGEAHAEVHALNMAGKDAEGATAYVTLEPCSHHGRTPPCCDRLIAEKVARVVVATTDPNRLV